jgi:hypothetical protein
MYKPYPYRFRELLDASAPINPLAKHHLPDIEIAIPSTKKDLPLLKLVIESAVTSCINKVNKVRIVVPPHEVKEFEQYVLRENLQSLNIEIINESDLLGNYLHLCESVAPSSRRGWLIQQVIKFLCAAKSASAGVLIIDSDTILLQPRAWLSDKGIQLLMMSLEYHPPYQEHYMEFQRSFSGLTKIECSPAVSFVTHHQLMQPFLVKKMFGGESSWTEGLEKWINLVNFKEFSPACEYHSYGTFVSTQFRHLCEEARWGNRSISRSKFENQFTRSQLKRITRSEPDALSISFHSYL